MRDLRALPKAELHIHMEGAMRVTTVLELVERNGVSPPSGLTESGWRFSGPHDFIAQYIALCGLMTRLEDYQRLGRAVAEGPWSATDGEMAPAAALAALLAARRC